MKVAAAVMTNQTLVRNEATKTMTKLENMKKHREHSLREPAILFVKDFKQNILSHVKPKQHHRSTKLNQPVLKKSSLVQIQNNGAKPSWKSLNHSKLMVPGILYPKQTLSSPCIQNSHLFAKPTIKGLRQGIKRAWLLRDIFKVQLKIRTAQLWTLR